MQTFSALLAICAGNSPVPGEFPAQRPVTRNFDVFFDLRLNKRLSKQSLGWWFETPTRPLWRHRNVITTQLRPCLIRPEPGPDFKPWSWNNALINKITETLHPNPISCKQVQNLDLFDYQNIKMSNLSLLTLRSYFGKIMDCELTKQIVWNSHWLLSIAVHFESNASASGMVSWLYDFWRPSEYKDSVLPV